MGPRTSRDAEEGPEGESRTKGCAGCHREVNEGRFTNPPPHAPLPGVRRWAPGRGRRLGCAGRRGRGWRERLLLCWQWERALGGAAWQCFPGPHLLLPFLCGICLVPVCHCVWIWSGVRFQPSAESQVVASNVWVGGACASTGQIIKDPPLFLETFCLCVCVL